MFDGQIEMSFGQAGRLGSGGKRRQTRAQWWFQRMRQVVDLAIDWQPTPPPRPVQIWFPVAELTAGPRNTRRPVDLGEERQICE